MLATASGLAGVAWLTWLWHREQRRGGDQRDRLFDRCGGLLAADSVERRRPDYPVLRGRWRGRTVELRPITDTITARKLPVLWLQVSLLAPTGAGSVLDALLRPLGGEFWSPASELETRLRVPLGLPATLQLRGDHPAAADLLLALQAQAAFLKRPDAKEILVTPKGVRLVVLLAEGERAAYLLLRQARFAVDELDPALVRVLLDHAFALHQDVVALTHGQAPDAAA